MFREEWESLIPHIEDDIRCQNFQIGENEMSQVQAPWQSNYHDDRCQCSGCREICQDDYEFLLERQALAQAWEELQSVPSYVEVQAALFASEK